MNETPRVCCRFAAGQINELMRTRQLKKSIAHCGLWFKVLVTEVNGQKYVYPKALFSLQLCLLEISYTYMYRTYASKEM